MTATALNITRSQLAEFLKNPRSIKQFEKLFQVAAPLVDVSPDFVNELSFQISLLEARSNEALDQLERIAQALETLAAASRTDEYVPGEDNGPTGVDTIPADDLSVIMEYLESMDDVSAPADYLDPADDTATREEIGTLAAQDSDNVSISGGVVSAQLKNNQTILLETTAALTNGAAAAIGTLLNAPAAGDPTKWVPINDNGTTRYIPAW